MQKQEWVVPGAPVKGYVWHADEAHEAAVQNNVRGVVLLSHGFGEYAARYESRYHGLIPELNKAGFTVYAYDQRGHGQSGGKPATADMERLVDDHLKAREALRNQPLPVYLFGHSMGGLVAAASAARDPRGLSGVILSSAALLVGEDEPALVKAVAPLLAKVAPGLPITELDTRHLSRLSAEVEAYQADKSIYHGKVPALSASSMLGLSTRLWKHAAQWRLPTLIFHGAADKVTDVRGSRRFAQTIASPDKTYVEFEGGYHELLNDQPRAEVRELIVSWLNEHTQSHQK